MVVGVTLAVLASGVFPAGFVRMVEPHPGLRVDPLVLIVGGALLLLGLLGWVGLSLLLGRHTPAVTMPSRASELVARRAPSPATAAGARFALTRHARSTTSALGTCAVLGAIVAGIVAAVGFAASVDRLVTDGSSFRQQLRLRRRRAEQPDGERAAIRTRHRPEHRRTHDPER